VSIRSGNVAPSSRRRATLPRARRWTSNRGCASVLATPRPIYGFHAVTARLRQRPDSVRALYVSAARHDARTRDLLARASAAGSTVHAADDARLRGVAGAAPHT